VLDVARGIGMDERIGRKFLQAGPGIGGSCFPKDTLALVKTAHDADSPVRLVETTVTVNDQRKRAMAKKVIRACGGTVRGKTIAILGLTFKPDTDDVRESPAIPIITALQDAGARIRAFDPEGTEQAQTILKNIAYCEDAYDAAAGADALVIVTEWGVFRDLDLARLKQTMAAPVMVDLRNIYDAATVRVAGISYTGIGRSDGTDRRSLVLHQAAE
jgi:UDPglucose 6-dehydrogenase